MEPHVRGKSRQVFRVAVVTPHGPAHERQNLSENPEDRSPGMGIPWGYSLLEVGDRSETYESRRISERPLLRARSP